MIVLNKFVCYVTVLVLTVIQKIPPVAPQAISVITETLKTVNLGGTVELTCTYDTTTRREDIRIYWLKVKAQGDELILEIPDESTSVVHDPYKGRFKRQGDNNLEINDVVLADAGLYKCNVTTKGVIIQSSSSAVELVVNGDDANTTLIVVLLLIGFFIAFTLVFLLIYISRKKNRNKGSSFDAVSSEGAEDKGLNKKFMWNDVSLETSGQCPPSPGGHSSVTSYPCSTAFSERSVSDIWSFFSGDTRGSIAYPPPTPLNGTLEAGSMPYPSPAQLSGTFDWGFMGHPSSKKKRPYPSQNHAQNPVITKDANRT